MLERFACQFVSFGIQILLARLIAPEEFGLLVLLTIFIVISNLIIDGGFGQAIIQKEKICRKDVSTVFFFNILLSLVMYAVVFFLAPHIADYYQEPRLTLLMRVLGINLLISAFGKMQYSLMVRELQFERLFRITLPSLVISGVIGVMMAMMGFEVWAIVGYQLGNTLLLNISYWVFGKNQLTPGLEFSFNSLSQMGKFGISLLASAILNQGVQNVYGLLIGKAFSFEQLAFYNRARSFHTLPARTLSQVLNRVMFPVFATIQNDNERILRGVRKGVPFIAFVVVPVMAFLICAADEIVVLLLTDKWLPSAKYMRWFPILGVTYPLAAFELSVLKSKGKSGLFFALDIVKSSVSIAILLFTIQFGVMEVVIGQIVTSMISIVFVNAPAFSYTFGYRLKDQLFDVLPSVLVGAIACATAFFVGQLFVDVSMILLLLLKMAIFGVVYLSLSHVFQLSGMSEVLERLRKLLSQRKQKRQDRAQSIG